MNTLTRPLRTTLDWLFASVWLFIIVVSVIDGYLLVKCRDVINETERNPIGVALLALNDGQVWIFLALKYLGTILACTTMLVVYRVNFSLGISIATVTACFQAMLLVFLHYA
jgi:tryptophan-rich sensory protein